MMSSRFLAISLALMTGASFGASAAPAQGLLAPAPGADVAKDDLCVVGRAVNRRDALAEPDKPELNQRELEALVDALLSCATEDMKIDRQAPALPPAQFARALGIDVTMSTAAGNA